MTLYQVRTIETDRVLFVGFRLEAERFARERTKVDVLVEESPYATAVDCVDCGITLRVPKGEGAATRCVTCGARKFVPGYAENERIA